MIGDPFEMVKKISAGLERRSPRLNNAELTAALVVELPATPSSLLTIVLKDMPRKKLVEHLAYSIFERSKSHEDPNTLVDELAEDRINDPLVQPTMKLPERHSAPELLESRLLNLPHTLARDA
jgi:hypothetical protein